MLRFSLPLFLSVLFLFAFGCEKDNFDITEEIPETTDPIIVEVEDPANFISYRMPSGTVINQTGVGLINEQGFVGLATSETAIAECLDGGVISLSTDGAGLVLGFITDPAQVFLVNAFDLEDAAGVSAFGNPACEAAPSVLDLTILTDDQAAGTLSVELFTVNPANPISFECEDIISLGVIDVEFNVELSPCN